MTEQHPHVREKDINQEPPEQAQEPLIKEKERKRKEYERGNQRFKKHSSTRPEGNSVISSLRHPIVDFLVSTTRIWLLVYIPGSLRFKVSEPERMRNRAVRTTIGAQMWWYGWWRHVSHHSLVVVSQDVEWVAHAAVAGWVYLDWGAHQRHE